MQLLDKKLDHRFYREIDDDGILWNLWVLMIVNDGIHTSSTRLNRYGWHDRDDRFYRLRHAGELSTHQDRCTREEAEQIATGWGYRLLDGIKRNVAQYFNGTYPGADEALAQAFLDRHKFPLTVRELLTPPPRRK